MVLSGSLRLVGADVDINSVFNLASLLETDEEHQPRRLDLKLPEPLVGLEINGRFSSFEIGLGRWEWGSMSTDCITDPGVTLTIQNVVASAALGVEIDLESVALDLSEADFDYEQFSGLIYRPKLTEATCLVFRSGKLTCTGGGSVQAAQETIQATVDAFRELGIDIPEVDITVQNVVLDADLGEALDLEAIAIGLGLGNVEYEPEQFPGLVYRLSEPDVVVLLFGTGKMVITGTQTRNEAEDALRVIIDRLDDLALLG